jgi:hypothetical protein
MVCFDEGIGGGGCMRDYAGVMGVCCKFAGAFLIFGSAVSAFVVLFGLGLRELCFYHYIVWWCMWSLCVVVYDYGALYVSAENYLYLFGRATLAG